MKFGYEERNIGISTLKEETVDLLIIGGGITGAGVAVQAAAAGLSTALIEMQDFAEGTSSRSTKLVHGGIRYLKTFDVDVVSDTVTERAHIQRIAPHIVKPTMMLLPVYDEPDATYDMFELKIAMDLYDRLAGVMNPQFINRVLTKEEVIKREPQILQDNLLGGGLYLDYYNDDARLVIENMKRAAEAGAILLSKTRALAMLYDDQGMASSVKVQDVLLEEEYTINARLIINTAGPWVDQVRALDIESEFVAEMRPTKGVHFVVDKNKLPVSQPIYLDTGKGDGRMVFVIPRADKTYFGTTDTDYQGDYAYPKVAQTDVDYLLSIVNFRFPNAKLTIDAIEASWAGLRPLIQANAGSNHAGTQKFGIDDAEFNALIAAVQAYLKDSDKRPEVEKAISDVVSSSHTANKGTNPSQVSRGSTLEVSSSGLITLAGGKITDYRLMAERALALIVELMQTRYQRSVQLIDSTNYAVSGGALDANNVMLALADLAKEAEAKGFFVTDANYLADLYGSNLPTVLTYDTTFAGLDRKTSTALNYALHEEMVLTPVDFLMRRTNYLLFMNEAMAALRLPVLEAMDTFFNWSEAEKKKQLEELDAIIGAVKLAGLKK